jgi:hypothetical protein
VAKPANQVFLNFPFNEDYEPLYVALVAGVTAFGATPRTVLEIDTQRARLERLRTLIAECDASIHDLSCVEAFGDPPLPRFNMPFELGLTLGIHRDEHRWFIFERVPYRASRSLSDLGGYDGAIHRGTPEGVLQAVTNAIGTKDRRVRHGDLLDVWRNLRDVAPRIRKDRGSLFNRAAFEDLVFAAKAAVGERFSPHPSAPAKRHRSR